MQKNELTNREQEVMQMMIKGYNNPEISEKLCISIHTAKAHVSSIYEKLNVTNRVQAIVKYILQAKV